MKYIFLFAVVVLLAMGVSNAAIAKVNLNNPKHPGMCTVNEGLILAPGGAAKDPTQCAQITCGQNGNAEIQTCSTVAPPLGCKLGDFLNINRPYPECCERVPICAP